LEIFGESLSDGNISMSDAFLNGVTYSIMLYINGKRRLVAFQICLFHPCNLNRNRDTAQPILITFNGRTDGTVYGIPTNFGLLVKLRCSYTCVQFHENQVIPSLFLKNFVPKFSYLIFCNHHISADYRPIVIKLLSKMDINLRIIQ